MSGGSLQYAYFKFDNVANEIEEYVNKQGTKKDDIDLFSRREFYDEYPDEKFHKPYTKEVDTLLKDSIKQIRKAAIYAKAVEYFLSGDTGEDDFPIRLTEELNKLK